MISESILVSLLGVLVTLVGIFVSAKATRDKVTQELNTSQAVTNNEIKHLAEEVKKHNNFAQRIPVIEGDIKVLEEKISVANHRIQDLEKEVQK